MAGSLASSKHRIRNDPAAKPRQIDYCGLWGGFETLCGETLMYALIAIGVVVTLFAVLNVIDYKRID